MSTLLSVGVISKLPYGATSGMEVVWMKGGSTQEVRTWLLLSDGSPDRIGVLAAPAGDVAALDQVKWFGPAEYERISVGSGFAVSRDKKSVMVVHTGAGPDTDCELRVEGGKLMRSVGTEAMESRCFEEVTSPFRIPASVTA